jgi:hypothetical protein
VTSAITNSTTLKGAKNAMAASGTAKKPGIDRHNRAALTGRLLTGGGRMIASRSRQKHHRELSPRDRDSPVPYRKLAFRDRDVEVLVGRARLLDPGPAQAKAIGHAE